MKDTLNPDTSEDADIAALLRIVGPRPAASAQAMAEVRAAVAAEWRAVVTARQRRRRFAGWATAASVVAAAIAIWLVRPLVQPTPVVVASIVRVTGSVEQNRGDGRWTTLADGAALESGTRVRTAAGARVALRLDTGIELRLDSRTLLAVDDTVHATLERGGVYVDSGGTDAAASPDFELGTRAGSVRHLGTQYQARVDDGTLRVAVREGRVRVSGDTLDVIASAGEQLDVTSGRVTRSPLATSAADWAWVGSVTPPFDIDGRTVESFLAWAARETGRTVVFTSAEAARQARTITLSGTVQDLTPEAAVQAVLSTTSLQPQIGTEHIRVGTPTPP